MRRTCWFKRTGSFPNIIFGIIQSTFAWFLCWWIYYHILHKGQLIVAHLQRGRLVARLRRLCVLEQLQQQPHLHKGRGIVIHRCSCNNGHLEHLTNTSWEVGSFFPQWGHRLCKYLFLTLNDNYSSILLRREHVIH